jgi:putative ABC transport system permease protein
MSFCQDIRQAVRLLRKAPSFTLAAMFVLALGIGATTAIFSLVDAAFIRPLPFREAHQLMMLWARSERSGKDLVSMLDFLDWKEQNNTFAGLAALVPAIQSPLSDETGGSPETVALQDVTGAFFDVLGVTPIAGRTFSEQDDLTPSYLGAGVVLSERLWRTRFGADPGIVGRTIRLGAPPRPWTVIGIVPAAFQLLATVDVWEHLPVKRADAARGQGVLQVIGRLRPDASIEQAGADLAVVARNIERIAPATNKGWSVFVEPLREAIVGDDLRTTSLVLGGVVLFVPLLACAKPGSFWPMASN